MAKFGLGEYALFALIIGYALFKLLHIYIFIAGLTCALAVGCFYEWKRLGYFKERGVPGPPPVPIYGNAEMFFQNADMRCDMRWPEIYGPIFGFFGLGFAGKCLCVSDPAVLRRVLVADFAHFADRAEMEDIEVFVDESRIASKFISVASGQRWKDRRRTITPAFTTGRIKTMSHIVVRCAHVLAGVLGEYADGGAPVDIKSVCNSFTLDVIAQAALAQDINVQRSDNTPFRKYCEQMIDVTMTDPVFLLRMFFPRACIFAERALGVQLMFSEGERFFRQALGAIVDQRRGDGGDSTSKPVDFLQLELDAMDERHGGDEPDGDIGLAHGGNRVQLSKEEIMADCLMFLVAGYATSSTTTQFMLYLLACNTDAQERCREEVDAVLGNEELSYAAMAKMRYIEAALHETLRLYPIAPRLMRVTKADIEYNGVTFHKGDTVIVPVWYLHHCEQYYPQPYKFDPERFLGERRASIDPMTYLPFGAGPRNCIGMRFAQMQIRMAVAHMLRRFEFGLAPGTPMPAELKFDSANDLRVKSNPIMLTVSRRS